MYGSTAHVHGDDIIYVETWKLLEAPYARPRARRSSSVSDMEATTIQISSLTDLDLNVYARKGYCPFTMVYDCPATSIRCPITSIEYRVNLRVD